MDENTARIEALEAVLITVLARIARSNDAQWQSVREAVQSKIDDIDDTANAPVTKLMRELLASIDAERSSPW